MKASENIRQILEVGYNGSDEQSTALSVALDLLEKQEQSLIIKCDSSEEKQQIENAYYDLVGVMHFVDKWLEGQELNHDAVQRADIMREKTLKIVEGWEKKKADGLLIELPVPIGEICYVIMTDFEDNMRVSRTFFTRTIMEAMIMGEPVFATKEEAEKRLEELKNV